MALSLWECPGECERTWRRVRHRRAGGLIIVAGCSTLLGWYTLVITRVNTAPGGTILLLFLGLSAVPITLALVFGRRRASTELVLMWTLLSAIAVPVVTGVVALVLWTLFELWKPVVGIALRDGSLTSLSIVLVGLGVMQVAIGLVFDDERRSYRPLVWILSIMYLVAFPVGTAIGGYVLWVLVETWKPLAQEGRAA